MPEQRIQTTETKKISDVSEDNLELSSFTQNIVALEAVFGKMEAEIFGDEPKTDRLNIYQSEAQSLLSELQAQQARAVALRGVDDENVQRLQRLLTGRLGGVTKRAEEIVQDSLRKLEALDDRKAALEAVLSAGGQFGRQPNVDGPSLRVEEAQPAYGAHDNLTDPEIKAMPTASESLSSIAGVLADVTKRLNEVINAHPQTRDELLPILKPLVELRIRAILQQGAEGGHPPRGPVDTPRKGSDDGGMEPRIANLEKFADEARKDLRSIDVRLGKLEAVTEGISKTMATRADVAEIKGAVSQLEATMLKWFIGTALTMAGLAFAAAKLIA